NVRDPRGDTRVHPAPAGEVLGGVSPCGISYDEEQLINGPNLLTLLRIFFVPLLVAALLGGGFVEPYLEAVLGPLAITRQTFALLIFLVAAATDLLDGYLARRWGQITTVGTLLEPHADRVRIFCSVCS